jgi:Flp pilus assembly protein TadD
MSRRLVFAATALLIASPGAAGAWPFGKKEDAKAEPAKAAPAAGQTPAPAKPVKSPPAVRAQADRLDPLARAAFWAREVNADAADVEAPVRLAAALRTLERYQEAAQGLERVLIAHPNNVEALLELARVHIARGQGFYAVDPARKAAAAAPRDWRPLSLLGVAYEQVSRFDDARGAWRQALQLSPDNPAVLNNLAMSMAASGQSAEAESLLRKAAARSDATLATRQNLALVLGLQGKTAEAERLIRENLPPEAAEQNLAWLRKAATTAPAAGGARTWESLKAGS